jgi:membrane protein
MSPLRILYAAWLKFLDDDGWAVASHIALSSLTALFPFMIFLTALASFFGQREMAVSASDLLLEGWPPQIAGPLAREIHDALTRPHGGLLTVGALLAIYFSSSGVEALRIGLNRAYDMRDTRSWWLLRLESILFVIVGAVLLLAITLCFVAAPQGWSLAARYAPSLAIFLEPIHPLPHYGGTALIVAAGLFAAHRVLPARTRRFAEIAPGVFLTLFLWISFGLGFSAYLLHFASNYIVTYAGLASIMMALVFLYVVAALFIYGAELNEALRAGGRGAAGEG